MAPQDLVFFVVVALVGYLLIVRPQRARARQLQQVRQSLAVGSSVMTTAGLYGTVTEVGDTTVVLEISDGVRVTFASAAVMRVLDHDVPATSDQEDTTAP